MVNVAPAVAVVSTVLSTFEPFSLDPGFNIRQVAQIAQKKSSHSWEYGATAQALTELYNPAHSVFGASPFPIPKLEIAKTPALAYLQDKVKFGRSFMALDDGNGAAGDPASMCVAAVMLGKTVQKFGDAAKETVVGLLKDVPRMGNGAISHRANVAEVWADAMYMFPPCIAVVAVDTKNQTLLRESVRQIELYREILQNKAEGPTRGAWRHIEGPESRDTGIWATGNAWIAGGMARTLSTIVKSPFFKADPQRWTTSVDSLTQYIKEIVDATMRASSDDGLVRNYMDQPNGPKGFGEIAGSSLLAAVVCRMAVLRPDVFGTPYLLWADRIRAKLAAKDRNGNPHITNQGVVTPAVNPLDWNDPNPVRNGSPEGQAFVVLLYSAWRDCILSDVCAFDPKRKVVTGSNYHPNAPQCPTRNPRRRRLQARTFGRHRRAAATY